MTDQGEAIEWTSEFVLVASSGNPVQVAFFATLAVLLTGILLWRYAGHPVPPQLAIRPLLGFAVVLGVGWSVLWWATAVNVGSAYVNPAYADDPLAEMAQLVGVGTWVAIWVAGLAMIGGFLFVWRELAARPGRVRG